jgi:hypothetical protein
MKDLCGAAVYAMVSYCGAHTCTQFQRQVAVAIPVAGG